jgi:hypothetical protein
MWPQSGNRAEISIGVLSQNVGVRQPLAVTKRFRGDSLAAFQLQFFEFEGSTLPASYQQPAIDDMK